MAKNKRNILVTSALPYANGPIHLGHLVEHIQTDIWSRFQRMSGHQCITICGDDAHGTPIMLKAEQLGIAPEQMIKDIKREHEADFTDFAIHYDSYHTTHSSENREFASLIYERLNANGDIISRKIQQAFDPVKKMFLPDRFVKGACPRCEAPDQHGDSCEVCGATYVPTDLGDPISVLSGKTPIQKESQHFFFNLPNYKQLLQEWTHSEHLQEQVTNKLDEWFQVGLEPWDISRDAPYFGFEIPGQANKYFYVWMDAPVGYMASFKKYCEEHPEINFDDFWGKDSQTELYHFVGKDIIYFHALFWPAMLAGSGFRTPTAIFTHGFLTVNGQKMSKSRGTFIKARTYLQHLAPEYLRYYFAAKLTGRIDDIDLNFDDFLHRVNADLVGKVVNIASRCAKFINKNFDNTLSEPCPESALFSEISQAGEQIAELYDKREFAHAVRSIMELADKVNQYIDEEKPWVLIKEADSQQRVHDVCSLGINLFRLLIIYLKPILPLLAEKVESFLNISPLTWDDRLEPLCGHRIEKFKPLMQRIKQEDIDALKQAAQTKIQTTGTKQMNVSNDNPISPEIEYDVFSKVDLRVAKIIHAESVENADKLLKLQVDIGNGETRQIFAGLKAAYAPEDLQGKLTVVVANLAPRKMRFGISEGMILAAAGSSGKDLWILHPDTGAEPGMRVK